MHDANRFTSPRAMRAAPAAEYLGVAQSTLWALRAAGEIEAVSLGPRTTVFLVESLNAFVDRRRAHRTPVEGVRV